MPPKTSSLKASDASRDPEVSRIDKWLWMARFYKSRSLAAEAVDGGKVHLNGQRVKPAKSVRIGDQLTIRQEGMLRDVVVQSLPVRRGPAPEAATCYEETEASLAARQRDMTLGSPAQESTSRGRPTKRARRSLDRWLDPGK